MYISTHLTNGASPTPTLQPAEDMMMVDGGWVPIYLCMFNVCMLMYKLLYFLYVVYVCNDESMHTNIMYKFIQ